MGANKKIRWRGNYLRAVYLGGKLIILEHFSEFHLLDFARCGVWHFLDVLHIVWNPPPRDFPIEEGLKLTRCDITLTILDDDQ